MALEVELSVTAARSHGASRQWYGRRRRRRRQRASAALTWRITNTAVVSGMVHWDKHDKANSGDYKDSRALLRCLSPSRFVVYGLVNCRSPSASYDRL